MEKDVGTKRGWQVEEASGTRKMHGCALLDTHTHLCVTDFLLFSVWTLPCCWLSASRSQDPEMIPASLPAVTSS